MNFSRSKKFDVNYLTEADIMNTDCTIERIQRLSPYLTKQSPELYKIFLAKRPDLGETVKEYYLELIKKLEENEKKKYEDALKVLRTVNNESE